MCGIWGILGKLSTKRQHQAYQAFSRVSPRGPDRSHMLQGTDYIIGFHRLAINGLSVEGDQPFTASRDNKTYYCVCNGEIYNYRELADKYSIPIAQHGSDCAVLLPLFFALQGDFIKMNQELHGEYSLCITEVDPGLGVIKAHLSTDPLRCALHCKCFIHSVRPMFLGVSDSNESFGFCSLMTGLVDMFDHVIRLEQSSYIELIYNVYDRACSPIISHRCRLTTEITALPSDSQSLDKMIVDTLTKCVERRLMSDVPIGCLLSGGLDSSLIAAIASQLLKKQGKILKTFAIGMHGGTDIEYGQMVADHIASDHTVIYFTPQDGLDAIDDVITTCETYDITTIRASVGQYLLGQYISAHTDCKVVLNGDGADECEEGYLYYYLAPSALEGHHDSLRLISEIHLYDGLRVDRCISHFGLEARVPFLDIDFVELYRQIDPFLKLPTKAHMEKYLIRSAFESTGLLPSPVLWRKKEAFSDGVSSTDKSWYKIVQQHIEHLVSDDEFACRTQYQHITPTTKEALYYRQRFGQLFGEHNAKILPHLWLPSWSKCTDPSARELKKDLEQPTANMSS